MPSLDERFDSLQRVRPPDLWPEIEVREPRRAPLEPPPGRRWLAGVVAFAVAAAGLTFAVQVFRSGERSAPVSTVTNGRIAFSGTDGQTWQIYSVVPNGSELTQLTQVSDLEVATDPAWSPDGGRIAYVVQQFHADGTTGRSDVWMMNADGSDPQKLTDGPGSSWSPSWSPDGMRIAYTHVSPEETDQIWIMNADGSSARPFTFCSPPECLRDSSPAWSPDGTRIAFVRVSGAGAVIPVGVMVWPVDVSGHELTTALAGASHVTDLAWSPDGSQIAFASDLDGPGIYVMDPDTVDVRRLSQDSPPDAQGADWSPDGRQILFTATRPGTDHDTLYVMNANGSDGIHELPGLPTEATSPSWQPVFEQPSPIIPPPPATGITPKANGPIYFHAEGGDGPGWIESVQPDGSGRRVVFQAGSPLSQGHIAWSPDGRRIAFDGYFGSHAGISTADPDGGATVSITDGPNDTWPSWSPDGTRIVFASTRYDPTIGACPTGIDLRCPTDIYVMDSDESSIHRLTTDPAPEWNPMWSPDGNQIAFVRGESDTEIVVMDADGTGARTVTLTEGGSGFAPSWSPDGTKIVFGSIQYEDSGIFVVNPDGTDEHAVLFDNFVYATNPVWSPDGSLIAFTGNVGGKGYGLYTVRPDGSGVTMIARDAATEPDGGVAWRPVPTDSADQGLASGLQGELAIAARIQVPGAVNLATGYGSVWVSGFGELTRVDPVTDRTQATISVRGVEDFSRVAIGEGSVWVSADGGIVYRIDPTTNQIVGTIHSGDVTGTIAVGDGYLWVASPGAGPGMLVGVDPETGQEVGEPITIGSGPKSALFAEGVLWVSGDDGIDRIDPATEEVARVPGIERTGPLAFGDGSIWSTTYTLSAKGAETDWVLRIDPSTAQVVQEIPVPLASAVAFADGVVWVMTSPPSTSNTLFIPSREHPGTVLRIDPATDQVAGDALPVPGLQPISIAAEGTSAWIADYTDQTLTRIEVVASASPAG